jgi:hypothetical protein
MLEWSASPASSPSPVFTAYENGMSRWLPSMQFVSLC